MSALTREQRREQREAIAAAAHPLGTIVTTTVHSIGGRSEDVSGEVVSHRRGDVHVKTDLHGTLAVPLDRIH
jgi:hypothetical protein